MIMPTNKGLLIGAFALAGIVSAGMGGQYAVGHATSEKSAFTVKELDPACARNVTSVFKMCSVSTTDGRYKIGNFSTDLHSENREEMYAKLSKGGSYGATYTNTLFGRVLLKLEPKN